MRGRVSRPWKRHVNMRFLPLAVALLACSCATANPEPEVPGYLMKVDRFPPFVAKELEAEFPDLLFIADGRSPYVFALTRDDSGMKPEVRAKLQARVDELDRKSSETPSAK